MPQAPDDTVPSALLWVKDAPMFIDERNLARFYDAIVRPAFKEDETRTIEISDQQRSDLSRRLGVEAGVKTPGWFSGLISGGIDAGARISKESNTSTSSHAQLVLKSIDTPQRQLEQLLIFFWLKRSDRLLVGGFADALDWQRQGRSRDVPRALVLLDVPPRAKLIPMAAEFRNGRVSTFFDKADKPNGEGLPLNVGNTAKLWTSLSTTFDPQKAMGLIEEAAAQQESRIEWIDFRLPLNHHGKKTMHMHIEAGGNYHTGTFAFRLVRRCYGHGMRIVGTLKDGPDLNVLAIYEK